MATQIKSIIKTWKWRIKRAGMRQSDVAEKLGISSATLSLILNGKIDPRISLFDRVEEILMHEESINPDTK